MGFYRNLSQLFSLFGVVDKTQTGLSLNFIQYLPDRYLLEIQSYLLVLCKSSSRYGKSQRTHQY